MLSINSRVLYCCIKFVRYCITFILNSRFVCITTNTQCTRMSTESICFIYEGNINTLSAKDGDLRLSAANACLPKTEISVFVTECVFFTSTCYKLHMFTLHDVVYS